MPLPSKVVWRAFYASVAFVLLLNLLAVCRLIGYCAWLTCLAW